MVYCCNLCTGYLTVSLRELLHHMRRTHSSDPNFHMVCGLEGCPRTYKRFSSFRNHVMRKHNLIYNGRNEKEADNNEDIPDELNVNVNCDFNINSDDMQQQCLHIENILHENSRSLLAFKENGGVNQTLLNRFVETNTNAPRNSVEVVMSEVKERLATVGQAIEDIPGLKEIFDEDSSAMNPFKGIETEQQQHKFYQNNFNLVVCYLSLFNLSI